MLSPRKLQAEEVAGDSGMVIVVLILIILVCLFYFFLAWHPESISEKVLEFLMPRVEGYEIVLTKDVPLGENVASDFTKAACVDEVKADER